MATPTGSVRSFSNCCAKSRVQRSKNKQTPTGCQKEGRCPA